MSCRIVISASPVLSQPSVPSSEAPWTLLGALDLRGQIRFLPLSRAEDKILSPSVDSITMLNPQAIPSRATDTSTSNSNPAWKTPRALLCFTSISVFSKSACCSGPRLYPFFTRCYNGGPDCAWCRREVLQNPQISIKAGPSFIV